MRCSSISMPVSHILYFALDALLLTGNKLIANIPPRWLQRKKYKVQAGHGVWGKNARKGAPILEFCLVRGLLWKKLAATGTVCGKIFCQHFMQFG